MLRRALLGVAAVGLVASVWSLIWWPILPPLYVVAIWSLLIVIGIVFERSRYKAIETAPGAGFQPTGESFVDSESGEAVRVFYHPGSGERRYVRQASGPPR